MASWMIHLRIADRLLDEIPGLSPVEFIVGNIAPDSGVPNADWSSYSPNSTVSHFRKGGSLSTGKNIDIPSFLERYFSAELRAGYDSGQYSFFLGYLTHLLADILWEKMVYLPCINRHFDEFNADSTQFIWKIKADWYDLDYKYLRDHPGFRAFRVYRGAVGFRNTYMDIFSEDAFDNRREYITGFYLREKGNLDREYPYLTGAEADEFVNGSVPEILEKITQIL